MVRPNSGQLFPVTNTGGNGNAEQAAHSPKNGARGFVASDEQQRAIEHGSGPMLVVAGAGTGKTTVLSQRIAWLIRTGAAKSDEILAVTYTRNAAAELVARAGAILYPDGTTNGQQPSLYPELDRHRGARKLLSKGLQAETFHSYCFGLLNHAGIKFELLTDQDLFVLLRRRIGDLKLEHYIKAADPGKFLRSLMDFFRRCHDELRTPKDYDAYVTRLERKEIPLQRVIGSKDAPAISEAEVLDRCREIARAFHFVEDLLVQEGLGTFGHIITRAVDLLGRRQSVLERAQKRARFILIDEFQDSNVAQIQLARMLAGAEANVFAVGDPDQAIYRFRGATSGAFDQFLKTFGADRVKRATLSANRRSTPPILRCAYQAIRSNPEVGSLELEKGWPREPLSCARLDSDPGLVAAPAAQAILHSGHEHEATFIADSVEKMRRQRTAMNFSDVAVLYRSHTHRDEIVAELRRRGIPVRVKGADLFDTPEVRDLLAALCVMNGAAPVSLFRIAALPQFSIDAERFRAEIVVAGENVSVETSLEKAPGGFEVMERVREARHDLLSAESKLAAALEIARRTFQLSECEPTKRLQEFAGRWSRKSKKLVGEGTLAEFLEYVALYREAGGCLSEDRDEDDPVAALAPNDFSRAVVEDAVQLMTVHAAKGLEFPCVFLVRVTTGCFPTNYNEPLVEFPQELRSKDTAAEGPLKALHHEEERRLFYVGLTRAMDELYVCGKASKKKDKPAPSVYIRELVSETHAKLAGAIECRQLPVAAIPEIHAGAELALRVSEWVNLPPRSDARLNELSASAVDQYERCPLAYKLKRDWNLPERPAAYLHYGNAMHLAMKAYFDGVRAGRPPDVEVVIACFLDEFAKASIAENLQRQLYEEQGRAQIAQLLHSELGKPSGEILETELKFRIEAGDAKVRGRIDRMDQVSGREVVIVDYKTGRPKTQEDADRSLQLSIYAMAALRAGKIPRSLVFVNLQNGTAVSSQRTPPQLAAAEKRVCEVADKIAAGEFDPKPSMACGSCSYRSICPAHEDLVLMPEAASAAKVN
jgi:DNA helicase-2/ATP-dependent DNA helicase PcrA